MPETRNRHINLGVIPSARQAVVSKTNSRAFRIDIEAADRYEPILKQATALATTQITDPFQDFYTMAGAPAAQMRIIEPNFSLDELAKVCLEDVTLASCIDSIATNVSGFGYTLEYIGPDKAQASDAAIVEKRRISDILDRCNPDESLSQVFDKADRDYNTFGHAYMEVGRDLKGNIEFLYHVPAQTMRATVVDDQVQTVDIWMRREGELVQRKARKRFRRFVQVTKHSGQKVFFKEFGDTRRISSIDGLEKENMGIDEEAVEIIWLNRYTPGFVYGLPKFVSCIAAIIGSREAALTNLDFFKDNAIPALAILVAGGVLSQDAVDALKGQFTKNTGRRMVNRAIVLEARTPEEDRQDPLANPPVPRLDIKPLTADRQGDALFQEYTKNNSNQIRQAFRLPPLLVGLAMDYTRATAESSLDMAEAQVFGPERQMLDEIVNSKLLLKDGKPTTFWRYHSNSPKLSSSEAQIKALTSLNTVGAMNPNTAITIANSIFGLKIPVIEEAWGELPFAFTSEMVKKGKLEPETGLPEAPPPEPTVGLDPLTGKPLKPAGAAPAKPAKPSPEGAKKEGEE